MALRSDTMEVRSITIVSSSTILLTILLSPPINTVQNKLFVISEKCIICNSTGSGTRGVLVEYTTLALQAPSIWGLGISVLENLNTPNY